MLVSGYVWNGKNETEKISGPNETSTKGGTAVILANTIEECNTEIEKTILIWEKVLLKFKSSKDGKLLIDYERV